MEPVAIESTSRRSPWMAELYTFETEQFWDRAAGLFFTVNTALGVPCDQRRAAAQGARRSAIEGAILAAVLTAALPLIQVRLTSYLGWFPVAEPVNRFRFLEMAVFACLASSGAVAALALFSSERWLDPIKRHLFEATVIPGLPVAVSGPLYPLSRRPPDAE
jgi:hypothetical protein